MQTTTNGLLIWRQQLDFVHQWVILFALSQNREKAHWTWSYSELWIPIYDRYYYFALVHELEVVRYVSLMDTVDFIGETNIILVMSFNKARSTNVFASTDLTTLFSLTHCIEPYSEHIISTEA